MWNTKLRRLPVQLRISVIAVLAAVLPCCAEQASAPVSREELDASILSQGTSKDGFINQQVQAQMLAALKAIRAKFPETAKIHALPSFALDTLNVRLTQAGQMIIERKVKMTSDSRRDELITGQTGIRELDKLNAKYGVKSVSAFFFTDTLLLTFKNPMDIPALTKIYAAIPEVQAVAGDRTLGDGDEIQLKRDDQIWQFSFKHGWGDCPSGCINKQYFFFSYRPDTQAVSKTGEERHVTEGLSDED